MNKSNISCTCEDMKKATDVVNILFAKNIIKRKSQKTKLKGFRKALKRIKVSEIPKREESHNLPCDSFKTVFPTVDLLNQVKQSKDYNPVNVKQVVYNFSSESDSSKNNKTDNLSPVTIPNPTTLKRERRPRKITKKRRTETVTMHSSNCINNPINISSGHTYLDESVNSPLCIKKEPVFEVPEVGKDSLHLRTEDFTSSNILDSLLKASEDTSNINVRVLSDAPQYITSTPFEPSKTRKIDCSVLSTILPKNNESTSTSVDLSSIDCLVEKSFEEIKKWDNTVPDFNHKIPKLIQILKQRTSCLSVVNKRNNKKGRKLKIKGYKRNNYNKLKNSMKKCHIKLEYCTELEKVLDWKLNCSLTVQLDRTIDILGINNSINCRKLNSLSISMPSNKLSSKSYKENKYNLNKSRTGKEKIYKNKNSLVKTLTKKIKIFGYIIYIKQPIVSLIKNKLLETLLADNKLSSQCVVKIINLNINRNKIRNDKSGGAYLSPLELNEYLKSSIIDKAKTNYINNYNSSYNLCSNSSNFSKKHHKDTVDETFNEILSFKAYNPRKSSKKQS